MADDVESKVLRYKSRLQNSTDEEKLQETLFKIADIPITVDILQKTKIGKVVNGLRKKGGDLGILAKDIVTEWKAMVARVQSQEEEEEKNDHTEKSHSSPEVENNGESPEHNHIERDDSPIKEEVRSPQEKSRSKDIKKHRTDRHSSHQPSSHSKAKEEKHQESENRHSSKDSRHSSNREKVRKEEKKNEENRKSSSSGDGKKSSSNDHKQSKSERSSKSHTEHSNIKSDKSVENHKSHRSHSKMKESQPSSKKESQHSVTKHSESSRSSKDSIKHSDHKHSSSHKSESRKSGSRHSNSESGGKDRSHSRHSHSGHSESHAKHSSSSSSKTKNHNDKKSSDNCDKVISNTKHSSSKSSDKGFTGIKRSKHTLSESESENSEEDKEDRNQSKVLGHWDGLSSDAEMEEEPGGFFFNDEYVDHEALLNEALNKYHMGPPSLPPSSSSDKKSQERSEREVGKDHPKKEKHSDPNKKRKDSDEKERKEKNKKDDSHSSHKSKSNSSSKSSSHKHDRENRKRKHDQDGKPESKKSRSNSTDVASFEESIAIPVKKPKADPNYEKLKSKFKIKKKGEVPKEPKPRNEKLVCDTSEAESNKKLKVPVPGSKLKLSERDLAGLVRNNVTATYRNFEEVPSATAQFDDSLIGQKSYAKTQVYSGKRNNAVPKVYSLQEICINLLMNYIDSIEAVGSSVPFYILEPVLKKCTPAQLYRIEDFNPHFLEESDDLWKLHCEREFRDSKPDEFETYRELYLRKFDEKERKFKMIKDNISQSMAKAAPERTAKLAYVDSYVKPPREVRRQQLKYGTAGPSSGERSKKFAHLMDPIAIGRKEKEEKAVRQKAPMMQKTMMMIKKMRR
ncbi:transcription elongation factor B polypeptide 3-like [Saccostrea cucullata]|uniref:transcription elongation factor B polypeptide 3-like n=1 Tax=Saccostrea cuccullata TaxID=36930 RepID=UPI002ED42CD9